MNGSRRFHSRMSLSLALTLATVAWIAGCSDNSTGPKGFDPPTNLAYVNGDAQVQLSWDASPSQGGSDFSHYDVFRHTSTMVGATDTELEGYRINTTPLTATEYIDGTAQNGTRYYYAVRAVKQDGGYSDPTAEIDTSPTPEGGLVLLAEFADPTRPSGFDISTGQAVSVSSSNPDNRPLVDLYIGTTDPNDASSAHLAIKSPNLVLDSDPAWATRQSLFKELADQDTPTTSNAGWTDQIDLGAAPQDFVGKVFAVKAPPDTNGEVHYGKIIIFSSSGPAGQRQIQILWAYQMVANYVRF